MLEVICNTQMGLTSQRVDEQMPSHQPVKSLSSFPNISIH